MSTQSNNDGKRILILDSALKLFSQFGFQETPTSKIAVEAGIAHGTVFHYFKTKDELILSLYDHIRDKSYEYLKAKLTTGDFKKRFQNLFFHAVMWGLKNRPDFSFRLQFENSPYLKEIWDNRHLEKKSIYLDFLLEAYGVGEIRNLMPELSGSLCKSHIIGTYNFIINQKIKVSQQKSTIDQVSDLLWYMLKK